MNEESFPEKLRAAGAIPLRSLGRLGMRHLPERVLPLNRYNTHMNQLWRALSEINTHHSEHHLLRRFSAGLPEQFLNSWREENQVFVIDTLPLLANVRHDSVELLTEKLLGERLTDQNVVDRANRAEKIVDREDNEIYRLIAHQGHSYARILPEDMNETSPKVEEYIVPTIIPGVVMSFSGLGIKRLNDAEGSELTLTFYSVPNEEI